MNGETRRVVLLTLGVFVVAAAAHLPAWHQYREDPFFESPVSDALSYHRWALRIAENGIGAEPVFHQAPLYPWMLSRVYAATSPEGGPEAAIVLQIALTSLAIALLVPLGWIHLRSASAGGLAAALALLHGPFVFYSLKLLYVPLALATQAAAWVLLGVARERSSTWLVALSGVALGVAALARPEMLLAAPLLMLVLPRSGKGLVARGAPIAVFALGLVAGIAPATIHNLRQGDRVVVASSAGENLYIGNRRGAKGEYSPIHPKAGDIFSERVLATRLAEDELGRSLRASEVSAHWRSKAVREVLADPVRWSRLEMRKLGRILHPGDPTDTYSFPLERSRYLTVLHLLPLPAWTLLGAGAIGVGVALRTRRRDGWPLLVLPGIHLLTLLLFFVNTRLRLPLLYALAPFGGLALVEGWRAWRAGRRRWLVTALAGVLAALSVAGALWTRPGPRDHLRLGAVLSSQEKYDEALEALAPTLSGPEPYGLSLDQAGWVVEQKGDLRGASDFYRRALEAGLPEGRSYQTHTRLAMALEQLGDLETARTHHDRAVASVGANAGTWYERGMFMLRRGDQKEAIINLRMAVAFDPAWDPPRKVLDRIRDRE